MIGPGERLDLNERVQQFLDATAVLMNQLASFTKEESAELFLAVINDNRIPQWFRDSVMNSVVGLL